MKTSAKAHFYLDAAAILLLFAQIAFSAESWSHKKPEQWTAQDVQRILTDSPWSKQGSVHFPETIVHDESPGSAQADPNAAGVGSRAGMPLPGGQIGHWDGGVGRDQSGVPTLPVTVRWDSALPVRRALVRSGASDETLARSATDYIVTILGLWPGELPKQSGQVEDNSLGGAPPEVQTVQEQQAPQELGHMRQELMASTKLFPKGQAVIAPEDVKLDEKTGAIHLFFPRSNPITLNDKEVTLTTQFGSMHVMEKFRLKDMIEKGKLEL